MVTSDFLQYIMDQATIINKILRDMRFLELIPKDITGEFLPNGLYYPFLNAIYVAAWEARSKLIGGHFQIKIELYIYDQPSGTFVGLREAVIKTKDSEATIKRALRSGIATKKGHIWKYVKEKAEVVIPSALP